MYSITAMSRLSGVKPETIRSWERRYAVVEPTRDANGRRLYSDADVRRVKLLAELARAGHSIGDLAKLPDTALALLRGDTARESDSRANGLARDLEDAVDQDDFQRFEMLVGSALTNMPPLAAVERVLAPVLVGIGARWEAGKIGPADEHAYSQIVKRHLTTATALLSHSADGPSLIASTLSGEQHEIGALMSAFLAASTRCKCLYLGPNLPAEEIVAAAHKVEAAMIALSLVRAPAAAAISAELAKIDRAAPPSVRIVVGVGGAVARTKVKFPSRILQFSSFEPFVDILRSLERDHRRRANW